MTKRYINRSLPVFNWLSSFCHLQSNFCFPLSKLSIFCHKEWSSISAANSADTQLIISSTTATTTKQWINICNYISLGISWIIFSPTFPIFWATMSLPQQVVIYNTAKWRKIHKWTCLSTSNFNYFPQWKIMLRELLFSINNILWEHSI